MIAPGRIGCCVPFCRRTRLNDNPKFVEWLCPEHWPLIDKTRRRVWGRIKGRWRRFGPPAAASSIEDRLWGALKRQAIERAAGVRA